MIFLCAPYASTVEMESASRDLEEWGNMYNISNIKYCYYYGHFYLPPTLAFEVVRFVKYYYYYYLSTFILICCYKSYTQQCNSKCRVFIVYLILDIIILLLYSNKINT